MKTSLRLVLQSLIVYIIAVTFVFSVWAMSKRSADPSRSTAGTGTASEITPPPSPDQVWVAKKDSAKSCLKGSGITLDIMSKELEDAGIKVLAKKKIHDSKARIQMCGADSGTLNAFLIAKKDLDKAVSMDFKSPSDF